MAAKLHGLTTPVAIVLSCVSKYQYLFQSYGPQTTEVMTSSLAF